MPQLPCHSLWMMALISSNPGDSRRRKSDISRARGKRAAEARKSGFAAFIQSARPGLLIALLAIVVYLPVFQGGFVWDDMTLVSPVIRSPSGILDIWFHPALNVGEDHYWPVVYTTFWFEHILWGYSTSAFHITNVLLHAVNCVLVWLILVRLAIPGAWLAAALFAVHPVHAESVAWIIERKDVLSGLFLLLAFVAFLHFEHGRSRRAYAWALTCFLLAMLSKSVAVTFPVAILICQWWRNGRIRRADIAAALPFFAVGAAFVCFDMWHMHSLGRGYDTHLTFAQRVALAGQALWFYAAKLVWPYPLMPIYPKWALNADRLAGYIPALSVAILLVLLWVLRRRVGRGPLAATLFWTGALGPVLGFLDFGFFKYSYVADRFQYLASIGPLALVAAGLSMLFHRLQSDLRLETATPTVRSVTATVAAGIFIVPAGILTWHHCRGYGDGVVLWTRTLKRNPNAFEAHQQLGLTYMQQKKYALAVPQLQDAVKLLPDYTAARYNLGIALCMVGNYTEGQKELEQTVRTDPKYAAPHDGLGLLFSEKGQMERAVQEFREAVRLNPGFVQARQHLHDAEILLKQK